MRAPSDRSALWARWRDRVAPENAGRKFEISESDIDCGLYAAKRGGQLVAVQIDVEQIIDDDSGELIEEEKLVAWINGERFDEPSRVADIWLRCAKRPLTLTEFKRVSALPSGINLQRDVIT